MYGKEEKPKSELSVLKKLFSMAETVSDGIDITVIKDREISIDGCMGIDEYTDKTVIFVGKNMKIRVIGEDLELYTFTGGRIKATGKISAIEYERNERYD